MKTIKALIILMLSIAFVGASCHQDGGKGKKKKKKDKEKQEQTSAPEASPVGYDLSDSQKFNMPTELLEISGIAFNNGDNRRVFAEQDEEGEIFYMKPGDKDAKSVKFGKHGDYEDIAVGNGHLMILRSDGELRTFPLSDVEAGKIVGQQVFKGLLPEGEYEGMSFDDITRRLYVLCKQCQGEKSSKESGGFVFNVGQDGKITKAGDFNIDVKQIINGGEKIKFRPAALARNPVTKQWFILSSVNKLLVIADDKWNVKETYALPSGFLQPEGMAFDKQGNLYISNEGDEISAGNILLFKYTP